MPKVVNPIVRFHEKDNVVVACDAILSGTYLDSEGIVTITDVPCGYKIATRNIRQGEPVIKYNACIGSASEDISAGDVVHVKNLKFEHMDVDYRFCKDYKPVELLPGNERVTFKGIVRSNGKVATRNYIGVFSVSNCSASVVRKIADYFTGGEMAPYKNVDGVIPFVTSLGCGMEMTGEPMNLLRRTFAGYINNPNIAGAVIVELGCERNSILNLLRFGNLSLSPKLQSVNIQELGGTLNAIECGINKVKAMLPVVDQIKRVDVSAENLVLALECGGSDTFSGITANPALGYAVDMLVKNGGTAVLSEVTELFGAEQFFTCRAKTPEVARKFLKLFEWWREYSKGKDVQFNGKVAPGNQQGGISNVIEKALGGAKKSGSTPLNAVYEYAESINEHGLVIMNGPGYDPVAITGQIASGCNLVVFTTGRGSCFGGKPSPVIKIASNNALYTHMQSDMDINCGTIITDGIPVNEMGKTIFEHIIKIASGEKTKSEILGIGQDEFVPWPIGIVS